MGTPLDGPGLSRRLAALADAAPLVAAPGRGAAVRRRARAVQRRRLAGAGLAVVVAGALAAPLPGLLRHDAPERLEVALPGERVVATFAFPDTGAVAELTVPTSARPGQRVPVVVRVTSQHGPVAGVDLTWGDGTAQYLDGGARCTPGAGAAVVVLRASHAFPRAGSFSVRAAPQVLTGCRGGLPRTSVTGAVPDSAVVEVTPS